MGFEHDTATWRVYSAEQSLEAGRDFADLPEADAYVQTLSAELESWWREHYGQMPAPALRLELGGDADEDTRRSFTYPDRMPLPGSWTISLHPEMLTEMVILHEVAHCLMPRYFGDVVRMRHRMHRERFPDLGEFHSHGPTFTATMSSLVRRFGTATDHDELRDAFQHYEVPISSAADLLQICGEQHTLHQFVGEYHAWQQAWFDESAQRRAAKAAAADKAGENAVPPAARSAGAVTPGAAMEAPVEDAATQQDQGTWVPRDWWGEWLFLGRKRPRRRVISQRQIAEAISVVEPCSPRMIAKLERSVERPTSRRDLRIAMAAAAFLDMDPIWSRTA
jgi:hypothetical protein